MTAIAEAIAMAAILFTFESGADFEERFRRGDELNERIFLTMDCAVAIEKDPCGDVRDDAVCVGQDRQLCPVSSLPSLAVCPFAMALKNADRERRFTQCFYSCQFYLHRPLLWPVSSTVRE